MKTAEELMNDLSEEEVEEEVEPSDEAVEMTAKAKRLMFIARIEEGEATFDSLCLLTGVTTKQVFGRILGELRILDRFAIADENGVYSFVEEEEYEKSKKAKPKKGASGPKISKTKPSKRLAVAIAGQKRKLELLDTATAKAGKSNAYLDKLRMEVAKLNLTIANVILSNTRKAISTELKVTDINGTDYPTLDKMWELAGAAAIGELTEEDEAEIEEGEEVTE